MTEVADNAIKESLELLNEKETNTWTPLDWEKWGEFIIITKKTKSDALNIVDSKYLDFLNQIERYFDITIKSEEKEKLYNKPSSFNFKNYKMGSPHLANFVEPGVNAILGYAHTLHLILYEGFEKIELQRKGIVGLIKKQQELEEKLNQYKNSVGLKVSLKKMEEKPRKATKKTHMCKVTQG